ncbi:DEAD/DEAH box helicase [Streptomyces mirabilis]|uniref:DEAD/DEAH box helicase n=2 Tax=Streptomyces mirabilis TaxID=68239 RepID=UPI0036D767EB
MTLPVALSGSDVIGQAKTGTGKTLGFGLPLLERVTVPADVEAGRAQPEQLTDAPQALVVVPTRELCTQVTNDLLTAGKVRNVRVLAIYGGRAYEPQVEALKKGVDVIVGTPGRLLDLAGQKKLNLKHIKALVLDEADEMLDLGFLPDVEKIMNMLPARRQTMLFSATMPGAVIGLARRYMSQPTHIRATAPDDEGATVRNTAQFIYRAHNMDKPELVARILQADGRGLAMVFCRTKRTAADLADQLQQRGFASGAVHGDLGQGAREQALRAFRNGKVDVLVCTDVAARGIDVEGVTHVINYQSPEDEKTYLHRIGRTGRAGAKGIAITLVDWDDIPRWQLINKALDLGFGNPPETYSTSPHLFEELNIPAGTKGVLPRSERTRAGLAAEEVEDLGETGGRGGPRGRGGRSSAPAPVERERERPARTPRRRRRTRNGAALEETSTTPTPEATTEPAAAEATEPRTPRRRRRTRAGGTAETVAAAATVSEPSVSETPQTAQTAVDTAEGVVEATPEDAVAKQRRRRTRKTAEAAPAPVETVAVVAESAPVVEAVTEAVVEAVAEAPAKPVRRRTRKAAEAVVDTAEGVVEAAPEAPATKPRRTRAKATAEAPAEAAVDSAEATAKPVRRRTRKAVAETVATVEAVAPVEAEIPAQTGAVEAVAEAPAKPVRRRTRKVAEAAEVAVDTAEGVAEAPVAKPRRTRKAAVAVVDAVEAAPEAPATKPRRTRVKATAEAPAEAAVDSAEATAKPVRRRTRKAVAEPVAEPVEAAIPAQSAAVDEPEAKPRRRARKVVEPVAAEAAPEAAAPRRRTRKAAAAAEPAES